MDIRDRHRIGERRIPPALSLHPHGGAALPVDGVIRQQVVIAADGDAVILHHDLLRLLRRDGLQQHHGTGVKGGALGGFGDAKYRRQHGKSKHKDQQPQQYKIEPLPLSQHAVKPAVPAQKTAPALPCQTDEKGGGQQHQDQRQQYLRNEVFDKDIIQQQIIKPTVSLRNGEFLPQAVNRQGD